MTLRHEALARANEFMDGLPELTTIAQGTWREKIALTFCHLSTEHHSGIVALVQAEQYSPAFALFRPQLEAWLRALWARWVAPEERLRAFVAGDTSINPSPRQIILALPEQEEREALMEQYDTSWAHLCDFTHGGSLQIKARLQLSGIQTFFSDDSIRGIVDASAGLAFLAVMEMTDVMHAPELGSEAHRLYHSIYTQSGLS